MYAPHNSLEVWNHVLVPEIFYVISELVYLQDFLFSNEFSSLLYFDSYAIKCNL